MMGGEFATARRGITPEGLRVADQKLRAGFSYQATARMTGIAEADLREMLLPPAPRAFTAIPVTPSRALYAVPKLATVPPTTLGEVAAVMGKLEDADLVRAMALCMGLVASKHGLPAMREAMVNAVAALERHDTEETPTAIARVALAHGVTVEEIMGEARDRRRSHARQHAYWEVRRLRPHLSLPQIGAIFGGRDHTTILHGIRQHEQRRAKAEVAA